MSSDPKTNQFETPSSSRGRGGEGLLPPSTPPESPNQCKGRNSCPGSVNSASSSDSVPPYEYAPGELAALQLQLKAEMQLSSVVHQREALNKRDQEQDEREQKQDEREQKLAEAWEELAKARKELAKARKELAKARKELASDAEQGSAAAASCNPSAPKKRKRGASDAEQGSAAAASCDPPAPKKPKKAKKAKSDMDKARDVRTAKKNAILKIVKDFEGPIVNILQAPGMQAALQEIAGVHHYYMYMELDVDDETIRRYISGLAHEVFGPLKGLEPAVLAARNEFVAALKQFSQEPADEVPAENDRAQPSPGDAQPSPGDAQPSEQAQPSEEKPCECMTLAEHCASRGMATGYYADGNGGGWRTEHCRQANCRQGPPPPPGSDDEGSLSDSQ